jgi:hypothetical protein
MGAIINLSAKDQAGHYPLAAYTAALVVVTLYVNFLDRLLAGLT